MSPSRRTFQLREALRSLRLALEAETARKLSGPDDMHRTECLREAMHMTKRALATSLWQDQTQYQLSLQSPRARHPDGVKALEHVRALPLPVAKKVRT